MHDEVEIKRIVSAAQLASLLEVSGYPKPGNVHRTADLPDMRYEHFLAGAVALGPAVREAAARGIRVGRKQMEASKIEVGKLVKWAVTDVSESHRGGNTHLGICLLFIPLAAAAGKTYAEGWKTGLRGLRKNVKFVMRSTTPQDSVHAYEAILKADLMDRGGKSQRGSSWLGTARAAAPDVFDKDAAGRLLRDGITLYDCMGASSGWDGVAAEWASGMRISFEVGYPLLISTFRRTNDINIATVHTFLRILSEYPDTFIARKVGLKKTQDIPRAVEIGREETRWISDSARSILELGGLTTPQGVKALRELDRKLQKAKGELNPGTTADLTASSLLIAILRGLRF